ncbi:MAG: DUF559 domain-containing protein [Parvibaculum sp.]|nr:DUF559 domain-containing protein [Parvibaculum sp.]
MTDSRLRHMRRNMTEAEFRLWLHLRNGALGFHFRRQHPLGPYITDFACLERRLIVEVDGGQHSLPTELAHDAKRTQWLNEAGFRVIRFWNNDVVNNIEGVVELIVEELKRPRTDLEPSP